MIALVTPITFDLPENWRTITAISKTFSFLACFYDMKREQVLSAINKATEDSDGFLEIIHKSVSVISWLNLA